MGGSMTIDGAILNPEMIEQIKEWQQDHDLDTDLVTLDRSIDFILERGDIDDIVCPKSTEYLQLIKLLRALSKSLLKFKVMKEDSCHE